MKSVLLGILIPILVLTIWEVAAIHVANPALLPRVEKVAWRLIHPFDDLLHTGSFIRHIMTSGIRVILGFCIAACIGIPLGLLVGRSHVFRRLLSPMIELLRPLCPIAWIPFALAVFKTYTMADIFGLRYTPSVLGHIQIGMLFVIFYGGFFPIFLNTVHGVKTVKHIHIESARLLGTDNRRLFRKVILPSALPSILTGLRVGLGIAWMVIIAAEMLPGSDAGIGYLIMFSYELAEMDILIASMILIGVVGALLSTGVKLISDRTSFWQAKER